MRFTRSTYPDIPGVQGSPCWTLDSRWLWIDADLNTRFPFGTSLGVRLGRRPGSGPSGVRSGPGFTLDLNAPLGEPNRLYLFLPGWSAILGLPTIRREVFYEEDGEKRFRVDRCWPRLTSCGRYGYHRVPGGSWERDLRPVPGHWGWLTVDRARKT